jgi:hypothetical protein
LCLALIASALVASSACSSDPGAGDTFGMDGGGGAGGAHHATGGAGAAICGNGRLDPGERCDGTQLGGNTCSTATMGSMPGGVLRCASCNFDISACTTSGTGSGTGGGTGSSGTGGSSSM